MHRIRNVIHCTQDQEWYTKDQEWYAQDQNGIQRIRNGTHRIRNGIQRIRNGMHRIRNGISVSGMFGVGEFKLSKGRGGYCMFDYNNLFFLSTSERMMLIVVQNRLFKMFSHSSLFVTQ